MFVQKYHFKYTLKFCKTNLSDLERMTKFTFSGADHGSMVVYSVFVFKIILASCISKYSERSADRKHLIVCLFNSLLWSSITFGSLFYVV